MRRFQVVGLLALSFLIACSESFFPASNVTDLRVVGARVEIEGAPGRANPSPGDDIEVSMLVIDQGPLPPLTWFFVACVPAATRIGPPICRDVNEAEPCDGCVGPPPDDEDALPAPRFQVPSEAELEAAEADGVVLQGVVCTDGVPSTNAIARFLLGLTDDLEPCKPEPPDPNAPPPPPEPEGRFVTVQIPIERDVEDPNLNPGIADVRLNGQPWPPPYDQGVPRDTPIEGCEADLDALTRESHPVAGSAPLTINLGVTPGSLQSFTVDDMSVTEEIQVSWLADGGGFEVSFSFITEPASSILTQWQPFSEVSSLDGELVRFNFVIRDGRGGTDWVERGLCVLPAPPAASPP